MDIAAAMAIYNQFKDTRWTLLKDDIVEIAVRYSQSRVEWLLADQEKRRIIHESRTATHNSLIAACDILARNMKKSGEDANWRQTLGADRKVIGDFACYLHCILGISAR